MLPTTLPETDVHCPKSQLLTARSKMGLKWLHFKRIRLSGPYTRIGAKSLVGKMCLGGAFYH